MQDLLKQCFDTGAGILVLQLCGLLNLGLGAQLGRWSSPVLALIMQYSINPLPAQIFLCIASGLLAMILRRLLLVEP